MIYKFDGEFPTYINSVYVTMVRNNKNSTWIHLVDGSVHKVDVSVKTFKEVLETLGWSHDTNP